MIRSTDGHHGLGTIIFQIGSRKATVKSLFQASKIFCSSLSRTIDDSPISADDFMHVGYLFHATFYFERGHTSFYEFFHIRTIVQILRAHNIGFFIMGDLLTIYCNQLIRQSTRLCTRTPIPTASTDKTTHQTLSRIGNTKSSMNKDFNFRFCMFTNMTNFI